MAITSLPPGFRFHPTDVELVKYYLKRKVMGKNLACDVIAEVDIYKNEPWDLPDKSVLKTRDLKWYFFCPREKKYTSGGRLNRSTDRGYWKTTGKDRPVFYNKKGVGMIKTLVYHQGRAPNGDRTNWVMHEYRMEDKDLADEVVQDAFVLCIIFRKEGPGPRNGAEYGAPFKEDEWSDDEEVNCGGQTLSAAQPEPLSVVPGSQSNSVVTGMPVSESTCSASASIPGQPEKIPSAKELPPVAENDVVLTPVASQVLEHDDILSMLDLFAEDPIGNHKTEMLENSNRDRNMEGAARSDGDDLFDGLGDLGNWYGLEGGVPFISCDITPADYSLDQMFTADDVPFIELTDLETPLGNHSKPSSSRYSATNPSVTPQHKLSDYDHSPNGVFTDHYKAGTSRNSSTNPSVTPQHKLPGFDHSPHGVVTEHGLPSFDQSPHPGVATQRDRAVFTQSPQPSGLVAHHAFPGFVWSSHHNPPACPESPREATQHIYSGFFAHSPELMRRATLHRTAHLPEQGYGFQGQNDGFP